MRFQPTMLQALVWAGYKKMSMHKNLGTRCCKYWDPTNELGTRCCWRRRIQQLGWESDNWAGHTMLLAQGNPTTGLGTQCYRCRAGHSHLGLAHNAFGLGIQQLGWAHDATGAGLGTLNWAGHTMQESKLI